jgi:hypothetical protein
MTLTIEELNTIINKGSFALQEADLRDKSL